MDYSVIIPIYNEIDNIDLLYSRVKAVMQSLSENHELIFVNDGSKDNSLQAIRALRTKDSCVQYIDLSRNFGHQIAVTAGLDKSLGNRVIIIDADLQDPPELIIDLDKKMDEGHEVVYAKRKKRKGESFFKLITAKYFYKLLRSITSIDIPLDTGDFRIMDRKIVDYMKQMPEQNKFLRGQISWIGFSQTYVEYERDERHAGETGYPLKKMIKFALDGITGFSDVPLRLVFNLGIFVSIFSILLIMYVLFSWLFLDTNVQGWTSLMVVILFIGGIQMIGIGIIGEYLSRVSHNVKDRPLYIIREETANN